MIQPHDSIPLILFWCCTAEFGGLRNHLRLHHIVEDFTRAGHVNSSVHYGRRRYFTAEDHAWTLVSAHAELFLVCGGKDRSLVADCFAIALRAGSDKPSPTEVSDRAIQVCPSRPFEKRIWICPLPVKVESTGLKSTFFYPQVVRRKIGERFFR